jgi:phosphatidylserine/phosphatidylglycerophosphate/cardiolipin synthase-like enzyme
MSFFKNSVFKKLIFPFFIFLSFLLFVFFVKQGTVVHLPTLQQQIQFYSSHNQQDLKLTFVEALQRAQRKIILSIFTLKDPHLIAWLNKKAKHGIDVTIYFDKDHNIDLIDRLDPLIKKIPYQHAGLMHRKILLVDDRLTILGSANFTKNSLWEDDNLVCGIYHEDLASWLEKHLTHYNLQESFYSASGDFSCYLTPDKKRIGIEKLVQTIETAEKKIQIAMYTFTHPEVIKALAKAKKKGVSLEIYLDKQMKFQNSLIKQKGFNEIKSSITYGYRPYLLHHKCAFIDEKTFIMGSTNWTNAGFLKNQDFLIFFENLPPKQLEYLKALFKTLKVSTN